MLDLKRISTLPFKFANLPLWKEKWPEEALRNKCNQLHTAAFNLGYRLMAASDESLTFDAESVLSARDFSLSLNNKEILEQIQFKAMAVDLAISKRKTSDYTVITLGGLGENNLRYLLGIQRGKYSANEIAEMVSTLYLMFRPEIVMVENNAMQGVMVEWLQTKTDVIMPIEATNTGREKHDLDQGLPGMAVEFKNNMWRLAFEDHSLTIADEAVVDEENLCEEQSECAKCQLIRELMGHPFSTRNDAAMSLWMLRKAINNFGASPTIRIMSF